MKEHKKMQKKQDDRLLLLEFLYLLEEEGFLFLSSRGEELSPLDLSLERFVLEALGVDPVRFNEESDYIREVFNEKIRK